jgi:hypothetical protein
MPLSRKDAEHVFNSLREGTVPERGLETFAVGIERQRGELHRLLREAKEGEGRLKFLRGDYGCGKTFIAQLALQDAQNPQLADGGQFNFATSFVVVSDNDLRFHKFEELYRKVVSGLGTRACRRGALPDIIDRWIGSAEEVLVKAGVADDDPDFDAKVRQRLDEQLAAMTGGQVPEDMVRVLGRIFDLKAQGDLDSAGALLSWLSGSENVNAKHKNLGGIKGDISSSDAMAYLRGLLAIIKAAGYDGLVIAIDEAETILRMRSDVRGKSLNGIRQIMDAAKEYPGLVWLLTGTPDFFDKRRGVAGARAAARPDPIPQARRCREPAPAPTRAHAVRQQTPVPGSHQAARPVPFVIPRRSPGARGRRVHSSARGQGDRGLQGRHGRRPPKVFEGFRGCPRPVRAG